MDWLLDFFQKNRVYICLSAFVGMMFVFLTLKLSSFILIFGALFLLWAIRYLYVEFKKAGIKEKMTLMKLYTLIMSCIIIVYTCFCLITYNYYKPFAESQIWVSLLAMIFSLYVSWYCGNEILTIIKSKKKEAFLCETFESIFEEMSDFAPAILIIFFIANSYCTTGIEDITKIVSLIIVLAIPSIKMYNFVLSEFSEYEKEHTQENKEKKQFNDVKQFINDFAKSDDLDSLEKNINEKRKKLEKEQFDDIKKFINKFATLEDLDNLEKIIAEKRDKLKNSNTEKRMD